MTEKTMGAEPLDTKHWTKSNQVRFLQFTLNSNTDHKNPSNAFDMSRQLIHIGLIAIQVLGLNGSSKIR